MKRILSILVLGLLSVSIGAWAGDEIERCIKNNSAVCLEDLLKKNPALVNQEISGLGVKPILYTTMRDRGILTDILLDYGADPLVQGGTKNTTPIMEASAFGSEYIVSDLIEAAKKKYSKDQITKHLNLIDTDKETALLAAVSIGSMELDSSYARIAINLLNNGASSNVYDDYGMSPMEHVEYWVSVVKTPDASLSELRQKLGASLTYKATSKDMLKVLKTGNDNALRGLIKEYPALVSENIKGVAPLFYAVRSDHNYMVKELLWSGANPLVSNKYDVTAIIEASTNGNNDILTSLIDKGLYRLGNNKTKMAEYLNKTDQDGYTALTSALSSGASDIIRSKYADVAMTLLNNGADPSIKDDSGANAIDNLEDWILAYSNLYKGLAKRNPDKREKKLSKKGMDKDLVEKLAGLRTYFNKNYSNLYSETIEARKASGQAVGDLMIIRR